MTTDATRPAPAPDTMERSWGGIRWRIGEEEGEGNGDGEGGGVSDESEGEGMRKCGWGEEVGNGEWDDGGCGEDGDADADEVDPNKACVGCA